MPPPNDIRPFVERLLRDPGATFVDEAFARSFNRLSTQERIAVMAQVSAARQRTRTARDDMSVRPSPVYDGIRNGDIVSVNIDDLRAQMRVVYEPSPPPQVIDESSSVVASPALAQAARIEQMRRDMARAIDRFREGSLQEYQRRPLEERTTEQFQRWSEWVERRAQIMRDQWEQRIAMEEDRFTLPPPPVVAWPDPAEYGPNGRYATQRGALSAFTRAVNNVYATRVAGGAWEEERDRIHINGTMEVRSLWRGWQEMPRPVARLAIPTGLVRWEPGMPVVQPPNPSHWAGPLPPPPTTQPWQDEPATSVDDETDVMIKHLPRDRKFMVVVPKGEDLAPMRAALIAAGISHDLSYVHSVKMMSDRSSVSAVRGLRTPVFIAPSVFKMHAARQGDWSEADLDALIELQGEIPDEETT